LVSLVYLGKILIFCKKLFVFLHIVAVMFFLSAVLLFVYGQIFLGSFLPKFNQIIIWLVQSVIATVE